jgi:arylsulfatase
MKDRSPENNKKPFFAYLPFLAPHWPLQCPDADRDRYEGVYDDGPEALRSRRLQRMKDLGIIGQDVTPHEVVAGPTNLEWESMTPRERKLSARAMQCYAGMVDCIDQNVGRVIQYLKQSGEFENTVIVFQSDNGAEGADIEAMPTMGPDVVSTVRRYFDNSFENIGHADSYVWYGSRWAQASTAPSRLYKAFSTEGGIRVPFGEEPFALSVRIPLLTRSVLHYPKFANNLQNGATIRSFSTVMDLCPTFLEMAGIEHPAAKDGMFRGRRVAPMRGKSWLEFMTSSDSTPEALDGIHNGDDTYMGWELFGRGAVRKGEWKLVNIEADKGGDGWQLYNISRDPGEVEDLAEKEPEKRAELLRLWDDYVQKTGVVWIPHEEILKIGQDYGGNRRDIIGGNHLEQMTAWMHVKPGEETRRGQVIRGG